VDEPLLSGLEQLCESLCLLFLDELPVDGAVMSILGSASVGATLYASNDNARRIDDLQFDLGEGPRWVAARTQEPVLLPDLTSADHTLWPIFGAAVQGTGVRGLFVYPMTLGALEAGVIELHSLRAVGLTIDEQVVAAGLVARATWALVRKLLTLTPANDAGLLDPESVMSRREIHQATGMVLAQVGTTATNALLLLRAHAFTHDQTLRETAHAVLGRELDFSEQYG
jgi:hypothetical protein